MENYERFSEIQEAAMNAEDASVLQYAKTLDSLETKLNQISNSFQQFYMSILNGPVIGSFLSFLNQVITGFTKLGNFSSLFNIVSIVKGVKTLASFLLTTFSKTGSDISVRLKQSFLETVSVAKDIGTRAGEAYGSSFASAAKAAMSGQSSSGLLGLPGSGEGGDAAKGNWFTRNGSKLSLGLNLAGGAFSATGAALSGSGHTVAGSLSSLVGGAASGASTVFALTGGNPIGLAVGAIVGSLAQLPAVIKAISGSLEQEVENLKKKSEELNIQRVEDKQTAEDLSSYIEKYNKLRAAQYDSAEAAQAYADVQNEIAEKFPQYVSYFDESGNAIIDMSTATDDLSRALKAAAESSAAYARQLTEQYRKELKLAQQKAGISTEGYVASYSAPKGLNFQTIMNSDKRFGLANQYLPGAQGNYYKNDSFSLWDFLQNEMDLAGLSPSDSVNSKMKFAANLLGYNSLNEAVSQLNNTETPTEQKNTIGTIINAILGSNALSVTKNGKRLEYAISQELTDLQKAESTYKNSMPSGIATMTKSYAATYADIGKYANTLSRFGGEDALISQMIKSAGITDPEKYKQTDYDKYADIVGNWLLNAEDGLANTLQEYLSNWDSVTQNQLGEFIDKATNDKKNPLDEMIANAIQERYQSASADINARLEKNIGKITDENKQKAYDDLFKSGDLTNTQKAQINSEIVATNEIIENKNQQYTDMQIEAAKSRQQLILDAYAALDDSKITPAQRAEFEQALYEDIGTYDWAKKLKLLADKYGIQIKGIDNAVYEALNTRLAAMTDNSELFINLSSAVDSQFGSGFGTLSDAKQMQQKLGLSDKEFDNVFEWRDSESAYFFKDWNQTYEEVIGNTTKQLATLQSLGRALKLLVGNNEFEGMSQADAWDILQLTPEFQVLDETTKTALKDLWNSADSTADAIKAVVGTLANAALGLSDTLRQSGATEAEATAKSVAAELKKRRKDFSSISEFEDAAKYFNADKNGYDTVKLREETGLIYDNMTDTLTKGREYLEKQLVASSDKEYTDNIQKQIDQMKLDTEEYVKGLTGKITQAQIDQLDAYGIDTTNLKVGQHWAAITLAWNKKEEELTEVEKTEIKKLNAAKKGATQYSKASTAKSVASNMKTLLTAMAEGSEVAVNDLVDIWETLTDKTATDNDRQRMEQAMAGGWQSVAAYLQSVIAANGYSDELAQAIRDIFDAIIDAMRTGAKTGISALKSGAEGTLSRADISDLATRSGLSDEELLRGATPGLNGYQLNSDILLRAAGGMAEQNPRYIQDIAKQLIDSGVIKSYDELQKKIKEINKNTKENNKELEGQLKILEAMDNVWSNMSDNSDWFNQDVYGATDDKFQDYLDKTTKAADLMKNIRDGEQISWADSNWILELVSQSEVFQATMEKNSMTMDMFRDAIAAAVDVSTGNVDFGKALQSMNMSFAEFGEGFADSVSGFAKTRIAYLEGLLSLIETQEKFAEGLKNDTTINKAWDNLFRGVDSKGATEDNIKNIRQSLQEIRDAYDKLVVEYFGEGHTFQSEFGYNPVDLVLNTLGLTPEMLAAMGPELQGKMIGLFTSLNGFILNAFKNTNWDDINNKGAWLQGLMNSVIEQAQAYANEHDIPLNFQANATIDAKTGQLVIEEPETKTSEIDNLKTSTESVATALTAAETAVKALSTTAQTEFGLIKTKVDELVASIETLQAALVGANTTETPMDIEVKATITGYINATGADPNKQVEDLNATVDSFTPTTEGAVSKKQLVDKLVATVNGFLPAAGVDANSLVSDLTAIVNLSSNPEELYNNIVAYMSTKKVDVAVQLANSGNEQELATLWPNLTTVEQALVKVKTQGTAAETTVSNVISKYNALGGTSLATSMLVGAAEKSNQGNIKSTGDEVDATKGKLDAMASEDYTVTVGANAAPAIAATEDLIRIINSKSAVVTVKQITEYEEKFSGSTPPTDVLPKVETFGSIWPKIEKARFGNIVKKKGGGKYQGTVNDLGPAYAQGTKTLVGELGPELAVYDNAYHLLGRNGAELVDIPDDAIIFNHKQTEGILKGQANNGRGRTVNGQPAFATGNIGGPAYATGLAGAKQAIQNEIRMWQNFLDATMDDLLGSAGGGGGGGGSGNTLKAHIEDLVEWYNLTRQIADIEQKINNIIAKRANITDGRAYLKSLREQQHLLEGQALVQKTLLGYQQKQLELQAEQINTHDIWKQFFHVGSDGLLQYNMGNEVNGGKGTLTLLQQLNQMSGADQLSYIKNLGYSYITNDGEQLDGEDLISQFFEEAQAQIDKYDELRDTVEETDEALSKLESSINEIEQEIRDNQKELEEIIYNTLVEAWEKQISQLQEQTDMLREANEAYVNGLNDALNKERNQYSQNKSISDRQQLQRQLSLLRRSGGSASQIASLEEQLNSALKEEYFSHQQETIDSIKEANDKQLDALNKQITLQQETLDFQKENGVLWTKVYEVLAQSDGKIMEFLIQNSSEFIQASALAQADMLNEEWAKRIGIYKANSEEGFEPYVQKANQMFATEAWNSAEGPQKQQMFNALDVASQKALQDYFASAFANEMLRNGGDEAAAYEVARQDMYQKLYQAYNQMKNIQNTTLDAIRNISQPSVSPKDNTTTGGDTSGGSSAGGGSNAGGGGKDNDGSSQKQWLRITYKGLVTTGNSKGKSNGGSPSGPSTLEVGKSGSISWNCNPGFVQGGFSVSNTSKCSISGSTITALASGSVTVTLNYWDRTPKPAGFDKATTTVKNNTNSSSSTKTGSSSSSGGSLVKKNLFANSLYAASGALIESDDTPAILHKGEGVFTAGETSALRNMVKNYQTLAANLTGNSLLSAMSGIGSYSFSNTRNAGSELNINPGAVVIHVDKLDDKYDVDELATDVFNKLSTIASKATNRGVNRR